MRLTALSDPLCPFSAFPPSDTCGLVPDRRALSPLEQLVRARQYVPKRQAVELADDPERRALLSAA
jgi:hypothetical protein